MLIKSQQTEKSCPLLNYEMQKYVITPFYLSAWNFLCAAGLLGNTGTRIPQYCTEVVVPLAKPTGYEHFRGRKEIWPTSSFQSVYKIWIIPCIENTRYVFINNQGCIVSRQGTVPALETQKISDNMLWKDGFSVSNLNK